MDKSLSNLFGVEPIYSEEKKSTDIVELEQTSEHKLIEVFNDPDSTDLDQDIALIRNNLHAMIRDGKEAFDSLIHIAKAEERVSAFEVSNAYLANLTQMNMQLLQLHEKKLKIKTMKKDNKDQPQIINNGGTTNIAFVGTTKDLLKSIKDSNEENE